MDARLRLSHRMGMFYALPNTWDLARRRLELLETCHDAASIRLAEGLGVGAGWHCLEAGAGHGSFARWLASRVGATGHVVAADVDVRLLDAPGVEVRQMDLVEEALPEAAFDIVHTRMLLLHLPARESLLARLAAALRPGGVLLIEEDDIHPVLATATGPYLEAWWAFIGVMQRAGVDPEWARVLPERLDALGLAGVAADQRGQLFRGGSPAAEFWSLTWLQMRDRMLAAGTPAEVVDDGCAALADARGWFQGPATIAAWGQRAAGFSTM